MMGISFASVPLFTTVITQQMVGQSCRVMSFECPLHQCTWTGFTTDAPATQCRLHRPQLSAKNLHTCTRHAWPDRFVPRDAQHSSSRMCTQHARRSAVPSTSTVITTCSCPYLPLVTQARGVSFDVVFGQLLGTTALVCLWPLFLSFLPYRALRKLFPPIVTGVSTGILHRECCAAGTQDNCVCVCATITTWSGN